MGNRQTGVGRQAKKITTLTRQQKVFCREYIIDLDAPAAYLRAGYSDGTGYESNASNLLKHPLVRQAVAKHAAQVVKRQRSSADQVVAELTRIAFADIRDVVTWKDNTVSLVDSEKLTPEQAASIAEVIETPHGIKIKLHPKLSALESLGKYHKLFTEVVEHTGRVQVDVKVDARQALQDAIDARRLVGGGDEIKLLPRQGSSEEDLEEAVIDVEAAKPTP